VTDILQLRYVDMAKNLLFATVLTIAFTLFQTGSVSADYADTGPFDDWKKPTKTCPKGTVWSSKLKKCVSKDSSLLDENDRYRYAVWLGKKGQHAVSIEILKTMADQRDPKVLTYLGYNNRKMGDFKKGVKLYKKALAIDPNYVLAREYLGEGYVKVGKLDLAREQLAEIEKRCGTTCEAYLVLAMEIVEANK